jgi:hypothetical protein
MAVKLCSKTNILEAFSIVKLSRWQIEFSQRYEIEEFRFMIQIEMTATIHMRCLLMCTALTSNFFRFAFTTQFIKFVVEVPSITFAGNGFRSMINWRYYVVI